MKKKIFFRNLLQVTLENIVQLRNQKKFIWIGFGGYFKDFHFIILLVGHNKELSLFV